MIESSSVRYETVDQIAIIIINNPPVNALANGIREDIVKYIQIANADESVLAIILIGEGNNFIAGADIRRFGASRPMSTRDSSAMIEASIKPVVAAIQGYALGGGFEHALACHFRIGSETAKVGLPEIHLGLIPGGGRNSTITKVGRSRKSPRNDNNWKTF